MTIKVKGLIKSTEDFLGNKGGVLCIEKVRQDNRKFIAAGACDGIAFAHALCQPLGNNFKHQIARTVTERIINGFKAIQVKNHGGHQLSSAFGPNYGSLEAIMKQNAIGQIGKCVVIGHMSHEGFRLFACNCNPYYLSHNLKQVYVYLTPGACSDNIIKTNKPSQLFLGIYLKYQQ